MLMQKLQQERLIASIRNMANIEHIMENLLEYCKTTRVDGKPLSKSQAVKFTLAEMATEVKMNRALLDSLIKGHMDGDDVATETMMTKYATSEMVNQLADRALDMFGDYGCLEDNPLVRVFRDMRVVTIFAGTTEVMKMIIAKNMGL
jgi:alkylation response protein AidB-like acyl-CoA dehydrogenase